METISLIADVILIIVVAAALVVIGITMPKIIRSAKNAEEASKQMLEIAAELKRLTEEAEDERPGQGI